MKTRIEPKETPTLKINVESNATVVTHAPRRPTFSIITMDLNSQSQTQRDTSLSTKDRENTSKKLQSSEGNLQSMQR